MTATTASVPADGPAGVEEPRPDNEDLDGGGRSGLSLGQAAVLAAALIFLAGAIGYLVGDRGSGPPTSAVDTGFLQDMIDHHDQAISMASLADGSASDPIVRHMAREVLIGQRYEIGLMDAYLQARDLERGDPDRNVMTWMGAPDLGLAEMPGLASPEQLDELQSAGDDEQNLLFLQLMRAHHVGGIDMAEFAARHAEDPRIRQLAEVMVRAQTSEIQEYDTKIAEAHRRVIAAARAPGPTGRKTVARSAWAAIGLMVAVPTALVGPGALPAAAHGGAGAIQLLQAEPTGDRTVALEVCVTYSLDADQADSARVTVRAEGPESAEVAVTDMEVGAEPGLRTTDIEFPEAGSWTVFVESIFPPAQLVVPLTVGAEDLASPAATTLPTVTAAACKPAQSDAPTWLVAGGASALAVTAFGGLLLLLRRSTTPPATPA